MHLCEQFSSKHALRVGQTPGLEVHSLQTYRISDSQCCFQIHLCGMKILSDLQILLGKGSERVWKNKTNHFLALIAWHKI